MESQSARRQLKHYVTCVLHLLALQRLSATAFPPFYSTGKDDGIGRRLLISVRFNVIAYHRARVTFARNAYSPTGEWCKKKTSPLTYHRRTFGSKRGEKKKKRTREKMRNEEKKERVEVGAAKKAEKKKRCARKKRRPLHLSSAVPYLYRVNQLGWTRASIIASPFYVFLPLR